MKAATRLAAKRRVAERSMIQVKKKKFVKKEEEKKEKKKTKFFFSSNTSEVPENLSVFWGLNGK